MKRILLIALAAAGLGGLAWRVWFKPATTEPEAASAPTEVPVRVAKLVRTTLRGYVTAYGTVEPAPPGEKPAASARVASSVPGVVVEVNCAEGQRVERGAVLFQLDRRAVEVAAEKARSASAFAERNLERQKRLQQVDGTSLKTLQETEQAVAVAHHELTAAETQQALLRIAAPLAGTVTHVNAKPGEAVDLTTVLAEIVDLDRLVVSAGVPSAELAGLRLGQQVEVLENPSAAPVPGWLRFIGPQIEAKTDTAPVRAELPPRCGLRPGQWVTIRIVSAEHTDRLAVPIESVVKDADGVTVIAVVQDDRAAQRPVKVGLRDGGLVEIEGAGLEAGMVVVTDGAYALPKETKVRRLGN